VDGNSQLRLPPFMVTTRKSKVWLLIVSYRLNLTQSAPQLVANIKERWVVSLIMISTIMFQILVKTVISPILRITLPTKKSYMVISGTSALEHQRKSGTMLPRILCMTSAHNSTKT